MSTATLNNLLEYLYGTLSRSDMRWVADHLIEHIRQEEDSERKPYTMDEINARIDKAESDSAAGRYHPAEDLFHEWGMKLDEEKVLEEVTV